MFDRRRNQYADSCYVCGCAVPAEQGWLYADTKSDRSRSRNRTGRGWRKLVKCDRCHTLKLTHKWQVDNLSRPPEPVVRPWSVASVRSWSVVQVRDERGQIAFDVLAGSDRFRGSKRDFISGRLEARHDFGEVRGKPLSEAATELLQARLREAIRPVNERVAASREAKVDAMVAAGGIIVERYLSWVKVRMGDKDYIVHGDEGA